MIKISHEMFKYTVHFKDIFCCDCFYDETYFLLRQKVNFETLQERFSNVENCYLDWIYGTAMVICHDLLFKTSQEHSLIGKNCITDFLTLKFGQEIEEIELCPVCAIDFYRTSDTLHNFKLEW